MRNGMRIVDADAHVIEPHAMWQDYLDPSLRDRAPRAVGLTFGFDALWKANFVDQVSFELLNQIKWSSGNLWTSVVMILAVGAITGAVGSGIAVGRYLKV